MPTTHKLKKAQEALDAQIAGAEQEEREAEEEARREEEECERERVWEQEHLAAEARARAEEGQHARKEEERLTVERDLCEAEGSSWARAPWRQLFLPLSNSTGSPEEEERAASPPQDKGKGRALISEMDQGEVTEVICNLCSRGFLASGAR